MIAGSTFDLEAIQVHAAVFRWRLDGREGIGAYELMVRWYRRWPRDPRADQRLRRRADNAAVRRLPRHHDEAGISLEELGRGIQRAAGTTASIPLYALERGEITEVEFARRLQEQLDGGFDLSRLRHLYFERIDRTSR